MIELLDDNDKNPFDDMIDGSTAFGIEQKKQVIEKAKDLSSGFTPEEKKYFAEVFNCKKEYAYEKYLADWNKLLDIQKRNKNLFEG